MDWNKYRNTDGSIDLVKAFSAVYGSDRAIDQEQASMYLSMIETLQPIRSRQAAAQAIVTAHAVASKR